MKLVIKLYRSSLVCAMICIFFSGSLIIAQQSIASIINVTYSQVSYSAFKKGLYYTFNEHISVLDRPGSFEINNAAESKKALRVLQFPAPGFNSSKTAFSVKTFVKIRRSASPMRIMQEKNLLKQELC